MEHTGARGQGGVSPNGAVELPADHSGLFDAELAGAAICRREGAPRLRGRGAGRAPSTAVGPSAGTALAKVHLRDLYPD